MDQKELRASLRVAVTQRGAVDAGREHFSCIIQDMSDDGLLFICTRDLEVGQILDFRCELYQDQPLECKLRVMHVTNGGVGAKIINMNEKIATQIQSFLEDQASEKLRRWM